MIADCWFFKLSPLWFYADLGVGVFIEEGGIGVSEDIISTLLNNVSYKKIPIQSIIWCIFYYNKLYFRMWLLFLMWIFPGNPFTDWIHVSFLWHFNPLYLLQITISKSLQLSSQCLSFLVDDEVFIHIFMIKYFETIYTYLKHVRYTNGWYRSITYIQM